MKNNYNRQHKNRQPRGDEPSGIAVKVRDGEHFEKALRRFKKKVQAAGIIQEVRERQHYEKPSAKRAKAKAAGRARWLKKIAKSELAERKY